jgi:acyl-CoA reductase-like NAD-dependent aldehyde dehydrogenase
LTDTSADATTRQESIGGRRVGAASGETLAVENPANGRVIANVPKSGFKGSGWGKDQSAYALEDYSVIKHVMAKVS